MTYTINDGVRDIAVYQSEDLLIYCFFVSEKNNLYVSKYNQTHSSENSDELKFKGNLRDKVISIFVSNASKKLFILQPSKVLQVEITFHPCLGSLSNIEHVGVSQNKVER